MFTITKAPGIYTDVLVDGLADSSMERAEAETDIAGTLQRRPSHQARGHTTTSRFSRLTAPVQKLATRTGVVAGTTAVLSPVAMAADQAASIFDVGSLTVGYILGVGVGMGIQSLRTRFATRPTSPQAATYRADSDFEARKQAALSRALPSLDGVTIPKGAELVALPAGEFTMGDNRDRYNNEKPAHQVVLSAFYMMAKDASNVFFREFRPSHHSYDGFDGPNQPVVNVDRRDAMDFADWMNKTHPVPGMKWRLPTEAEMEYAMRGKDQRATNAVAPDRVNVYASGHGKTLDVDSAAHQNNYGLFHIRGNVWKWCLDRFGNYSAEPVINPRGATKGGMYTQRGGSYRSDEGHARLTYRGDGDLGNRGSTVGFRLVLAFEAVEPGGGAARPA